MIVLQSYRFCQYGVVDQFYDCTIKLQDCWQVPLLYCKVIGLYQYRPAVGSQVLWLYCKVTRLYQHGLASSSQVPWLYCKVTRMFQYGPTEQLYVCTKYRRLYQHRPVD